MRSVGNSTSIASDRQQSEPINKARDAAARLPAGREREQSATSSEASNVAIARYIAPQSTPQSRIVVDIRSANLDRDYNVQIKQEPQRDIDVASAWSGIQALGALCITVLTIQKLWEDIKFIRLLRRELSTFVGSLTDAGAGLDTGSGDGSNGAPRPVRPRGASGRTNTSPSSSSPKMGGGLETQQLDLHLSELSELLEGGRGMGGQQQAAVASAGSGSRSDSAAAVKVGGGAAGGSSHSGGTQQLHGPGAAPGATAATGSTISQRETTWASISGLTEVKILLQEATVLPTLRPDLFQGIRQPPKALLLFGPPGTGKTLLARAVATESGASFFPVTGSSVLSMWYGQSEQNVKALFEKARRRQPAIIFIDEVDSLLGKRSSGGPRDSNPDRRVTNEFLAFIDGIQTRQAGGSGSGGAGGAGGGDGGDTRVVVIAATNAPWDLDEAALSRFSRRIYVPLPDKATREALMRAAMEGISCDVADAEWRRLAERCEKYSGRDLIQVCREAAMRPLRDLWGRRLLEGAPPVPDGDGAAAGPMSHQTAAAQQRLVDLVANSLWASASTSAPVSASAGVCVPPLTSPSPCAGGKNAAIGRMRRFRFGFGWAGFGGDRYVQIKKQTRRELERWKRRHGASWCDVGLIMQQAESVVESRRRAGHGGRTAPNPVEATTATTANSGTAATAAGSSSLSSAPGQQEASSPSPSPSPSGFHLSTANGDSPQHQHQDTDLMRVSHEDKSVVHRYRPSPVATGCSSRIVRLTISFEKEKASALPAPPSAGGGLRGSEDGFG
ncbi:hypothetical protein VaNZ11_016909, partial [Volvox africanus]